MELSILEQVVSKRLQQSWIQSFWGCFITWFSLHCQNLPSTNPTLYTKLLWMFVFIEIDLFEAKPLTEFNITSCSWTHRKTAHWYLHKNTRTFFQENTCESGPNYSSIKFILYWMLSLSIHQAVKLFYLKISRSFDVARKKNENDKLFTFIWELACYFH